MASACAKHYVPFVTKFTNPLASLENKLMVLRYQLEDGTTGCIGLKAEALETLHAVTAELLEKLRNHPGHKD